MKKKGQQALCGRVLEMLTEYAWPQATAQGGVCGLTVRRKLLRTLRNLCSCQSFCHRKCQARFGSFASSEAFVVQLSRLSCKLSASSEHIRLTVLHKMKKAAKTRPMSSAANQEKLAQNLEQEYQAIAATVPAFLEALKREILQILKTHDLSIATQLESRLKSWESINEKMQRNGLNINKLTDVTDLIGLRVIMLFKRDVETAHKLFLNAFDVQNFENTADRLNESQFGYQSMHYLVKIPKAWGQIPTFEPFKDLLVEVQLRTLSQHVWAASSHKLQYKNEAAVPVPIRRSLNRLSALLETTDLELERVLIDRDLYLQSLTQKHADQQLNVDTMSKFLDEYFPVENKGENEFYSKLLVDLQTVGITSLDGLRGLLDKHKDAVWRKEKQMVEIVRFSSAKDHSERIKRGVYYTHCGLARIALQKEFPDAPFIVKYPKGSKKKGSKKKGSKKKGSKKKGPS